MTQAKIKVLVVDDDPDLLSTLALDLELSGFEVFTATDGLEGLRVLETTKVHLIISDMRMPHLDGVGFLDRVKASNPNLPVVIFVTGFSDISADEAYGKGAAAVMSKPFRRKELLEAIHTALNISHQIYEQRHERLPTDLKVNLNLKDLRTEILAHVINIGQGGIFVSTNDSLPQVGTRVDFNISFGSRFQTLEGYGVVRWARDV